MKYVSEEERREFFLEIMNDIKKQEMELKDMKNKLSENEFYKKIEILKDAKLRARKAFINGIEAVSIDSIGELKSKLFSAPFSPSTEIEYVIWVIGLALLLVI